MNNPFRHSLEYLFGLPQDFLSKQGEWALQFHPAWPGQAFIGASVWNVLLVAVAMLLVLYVYSHDGRSRGLRIGLGVMRSLLFALVLFLLNKPTLAVGQSQTEPSVLAVLLDDSGSMRVPDAGTEANPQTRLSAVQSLLNRDQGAVLKDLSRKHNLRLYKFDRDAAPIAGVEPPPVVTQATAPVPLLTAAQQNQHRRVAELTLPGSALYFVAFLLLLTAAGFESGKARAWGLGFAATGLLAQVVSMIIRWSIMGKISAPGEYEDIIFSSWFGAIALVALIGVVLGLTMEVIRGRGLFGTGAGLVGWVALLMLFVAPNFVAPAPANQTRVVGAADIAPAMAAIDQLQPVGDSTQVLPSILTTLQDLQGQHVAGVVLLTDGRDTPAHNIADGLDALKNYGVKVYPIAVGSDRQPKNIEVQNMELDDVAFRGDIVNVKAMVRGTGYEPNHPVHLVLKDKKTGMILLQKDGKPAETTVNLADDKPVPVELQWQTTDVGNKEIVFEAIKQPGELDDSDNSREALVSVLDAKITILFVDGYPRWDYRYLKNALIRDKTVEVSCLLASADFNFLQEGNKPLPSAGKNIAGHFPDTLEQLTEYDVIVLGDVDPRYFSDAQLQLINEFVNRGGGFEMVAGERFSPQAYRNTPIEPLLPVTLSHVEITDLAVPISQGYRPSVTKVGQTTSLFRFFADRQKNDDFITHLIPEMFWYCRGITAKPSVGEVLAEHPTDIGPDGHKAPLLVAGRYGGRTLFSAMDDSWRWRFYTDEPVFDTYWVQQLRYLARNRKIGQRRLTMTADQPVYELGGQVRLMLRVIDPGLARQLPDQIRVEVKDTNGQVVRMETLVRQDGSGETYAGSYTADKVGKFTIHLPPIVTGIDMMETPLEVTLPRLELNDPRVDRLQLSRLASETLGKPIELPDAARELAAIPSVAKVLPIVSAQPLWDAPITMAVFVLLIVAEWVIRKLNGMV